MTEQRKKIVAQERAQSILKKRKALDEDDLLIEGDQTAYGVEKDEDMIETQSNKDGEKEESDVEALRKESGFDTDKVDNDDDDDGGGEEDLTELEPNNRDTCTVKTKNNDTQKINDMGKAIKQTMLTLQATEKRRGKAVNAKRNLFGKFYA